MFDRQNEASTDVTIFDKIRNLCQRECYSAAVHILTRLPDDQQQSMYKQLQTEAQKKSKWVLNLFHALGDHHVRQHSNTARQYYEWAASQGHPESLKRLKTLSEANEYYQKGLLSEKIKPTIAESLFIQAAELGHILAAYRLGTIFLERSVTAKTITQSIKYYLKAADSGHAVSQYYVGESYLKGINGFQKNFSKAYDYLVLSAMQNNKEANALLGWCYLSEQDVSQNPDLAIVYCEQALLQDPCYAPALITIIDAWKLRNWKNGIEFIDMHFNQHKLFSLFIEKFVFMDAGLLSRLFEIAQCFEYGNQVSKDGDKAFQYLDLILTRNALLKQPFLSISEMTNFAERSLQEKDSFRAVIYYHNLVLLHGDNQPAVFDIIFRLLDQSLDCIKLADFFLKRALLTGNFVVAIRYCEYLILQYTKTFSMQNILNMQNIFKTANYTTIIFICHTLLGNLVIAEKYIPKLFCLKDNVVADILLTIFNDISTETCPDMYKNLFALTNILLREKHYKTVSTIFTYMLAGNHGLLTAYQSGIQSPFFIEVIKSYLNCLIIQENSEKIISVMQNFNSDNRLRQILIPFLKEKTRNNANLITRISSIMIQQKVPDKVTISADKPHTSKVPLVSAAKNLAVPDVVINIQKEKDALAQKASQSEPALQNRNPKKKKKKYIQWVRLIERCQNVDSFANIPQRIKETGIAPTDKTIKALLVFINRFPEDKSKLHQIIRDCGLGNILPAEQTPKITPPPEEVMAAPLPAFPDNIEPSEKILMTLQSTDEKPKANPEQIQDLEPLFNSQEDKGEQSCVDSIDTLASLTLLFSDGKTERDQSCRETSSLQKTDEKTTSKNKHIGYALSMWQEKLNKKYSKDDQDIPVAITPPQRRKRSHSMWSIPSTKTGDSLPTQNREKYSTEAFVLSMNIQKSKVENSPYPLYILANNYCFGLDGFSKDEKKAVSLYRKAAAMGLSSANHRLGVCYSHGIGVKRNMTVSFQYIHTAALQGYSIAQVELANFYLTRGTEIKFDLKEAVYWMKQAASAGERHAWQWLEKYRSSKFQAATNEQKALEYHSDGYRL